MSDICPSMTLGVLALLWSMAAVTAELPTEFLTLEAKIPLGDVRGRIDHLAVDVARQRLFVAELGNDTIGVVDLKEHRVALRPMGLKARGQRIFVNLPDTHEIAVVDRSARAQTASWPIGPLSANYPLALDPPHDRVLSVFRHPSVLAAFRAQDGKRITTVETCGDSDDAFVDGQRNLVYVICGAGYVDVLAARGETSQGVNRISTASGARTGLFVPEPDRLFVAARARGSVPAGVWVFRPTN